MTGTSIERSRIKLKWAGILQLLMGFHITLGVHYAMSGSVLYAVGVLIVVVFLAYASLSLAFEAGAYWPTGGGDDA